MAGLLLFGRNPNRFLPQAGIEAAAYPGAEKDYSAAERLSIRGAMVRLGADSNTVDNGLWEAALHFLQRHVSMEALNHEGRRVRTWDYPMEVLREAAVNALVHRDYLLSATTIELSVYADPPGVDLARPFAERNQSRSYQDWVPGGPQPAH